MFDLWTVHLVELLVSKLLPPYFLIVQKTLTSNEKLHPSW